MEFHGLNTINFPSNGAMVFPLGLRGFPWNTTWYFHGMPMAIHAVSTKIPRFRSVEIPWNIYGAEAVEFHVSKTYETSMDTQWNFKKINSMDDFRKGYLAATLNTNIITLDPKRLN